MNTQSTPVENLSGSYDEFEETDSPDETAGTDKTEDLSEPTDSRDPTDISDKSNTMDDISKNEESGDLPSDDSEDSSGAGETAAPDAEYIHEVLTGAEALSTLGEAAAIFANAEGALLAFEATGGLASVLSMIASLIDALNTPERICGYQGLVYGLMYTALGMGDPVQNPGWPGKKAASDGAEYFADGIAKAKARLSGGQQGVRNKNLLLLGIAKDGPKKVVNQLWQQAVAENDHLLQSFTVEWPQVGPNG